MITDVPPVVAPPDNVVEPDGPGVTVATLLVALVQVPLPVALLKVVVAPGQIVMVPNMLPGCAGNDNCSSSATACFADDVNFIIDEPGAAPVTSPPVLTVAMPLVVVLHAPATELLN